MAPVEEEPVAAPVDIMISARAERRALEVFYLELRELAMTKGLEVEYTLTVKRPGN